MTLSPTMMSALVSLLEHGTTQWHYLDKTANALADRGLVKYFPYSKYKVGGRTFSGQWKLTPEGKAIAKQLVKEDSAA